jgi:8-oxo-dGTP diphosphatase
VSDELAEFLKSCPEYVQERIQWGPLYFSVQSYVCTDFPFSDLVTSVRAIVFHKEQILVVRDPESTHIIPGGRCMPGETWPETLRREIAEETGWKISDLSPLGVKHFHHLTLKPPDYKFPYPDFYQVIFLAKTVEFDPTLLDPERYELEGSFQSPTKIEKLKLTPGERHFLMAALARTDQGEESSI